MPVNLHEPATWYAEPEAEGDHFDLLEQAIAKAMSTPEGQRHPSARIVTKSGAIYGWDAINDMQSHFR
jgi:hypothetical protein